MHTKYSLHESAIIGLNVIIVHNQTQAGWRCSFSALADNIQYVLSNGWSTTDYANYVGALLANFDTLEDLRSNYPELFI